MKINLLEVMVKFNGSINRIEKETGIKRDELLKRFYELELKADGRKAFIWNLIFLTEKVIFENPYSSNNDIVEIITKEWNAIHKIQITREVVQAYLQKSTLRLDNSKRAFQALCNGDIDSYKMFSQNDAVFFSEMLIRFSLYFVDRELDIFPLSQAVLPALFENVEVNPVMNSALTNLGFRNGKSLHFDTMKLYRANFVPEKNVFANGFKSIILSVLEKESNQNELRKIYEKLNAHLNEQETSVEESDEYSLNDLLGFEPESESNPVEVHHKETVQEKAEEMPEKDVKIQPLNKLLDQISLLSSSFQQQVAEAIVAYSETAETQTDDSNLLQLEEENKRLYAHIEKLEQDREVLQDRKLNEFIKLIGGNESRYLLSELYEDSFSNKEGNTGGSLGKVQNLFNFFQMFGIEPFTYGLKLGEKITVTKQDLAKKYNLSSVLASNENQITVQLVRHGWLFNGKVIVLPLVEEITHVKQ